MNFDYLKNLDGLNKAYYSCNNAEELALTKPDLSMVAARKSAEAVAKFVYRVAHSEEAEFLSFVDILRDPVVKEYMRKRSIQDAFHFIRKHGNEAVHTLEEETPEEAIRVLEKLHYAVGETAKRLKLVKDYPSFDAVIDEHPDAELLSDEFYGKLDKEMYDAYVIYKHKIDVLKDQFSELSAKFRFSPGNVTVNEVVEYKKQPEIYGTIFKIQEYFATIGNHALEIIFDENEDHIRPYQLELTIYGEHEYTTNSLIEAINGILYDLPHAEGFRIVSYYSGPEISTFFTDYHTNYSEDTDEVIEENIKKASFSDLSEFVDVQEASSYKKFEFFYNSGGVEYTKHVNGTSVDLSEGCSADIVDKNYGQDWWCWSVDLIVDCDEEKHSGVFPLLHDAVRKHVPEDQLEYCERNWEGEFAEPELLLDSVQWCPRTLREVQAFLDDINEIVLPIEEECEITFEGEWFITEDPFAVATCVWTSEGSKIFGTEL